MNDDIETMLSLADVLKNISFSIKAFPQPYIIIKSELYKHFNPFHIYVAADEQPKKKASTVTAPASSPAKSEKKESTEQVENNNTEISAPKTSPAPSPVE